MDIFLLFIFIYVATPGGIDATSFWRRLIQYSSGIVRAVKNFGQSSREIRKGPERGRIKH